MTNPTKTLQSTLKTSRRKLVLGLMSLPLAMLPILAQAAPATAAINTTKLAVNDKEVVVGQLHSATGTMAIGRDINPKTSLRRPVSYTHLTLPTTPYV